MTSPMRSAEITVTNAAYATDPDFTGEKAGRFTLMHLGASGDPLLYVSFDGQTDGMILRPETPGSVQSTGGISYKKVWLRCSGTGVNVITLAGATLLAAGVQPGDSLVISHGSGGTPLDGTYTVNHVISETSLAVVEAFPAVVGASGGNWRIDRATPGDIVPEVESRASLTNQGIVYTSKIGGVSAGARTVQIVSANTTPNGIHSIVEVAGVSTIITMDTAAGTVTRQAVIDALTDGTGVTTPFVGSVNLDASTSTPALFVSAALGGTALSTGTAGVDTVTSTASKSGFVAAVQHEPATADIR